MMYNQKLVASLKANGKILREFKDTVYIPFGSEYSILLKNLNTVRAVVNIFIDGTDVISGGLVVDPGREIELERSVINGNLNEGNRFKFIERTGAVEEHRGIKLEDGLIRIEFQFEAPRPVLEIGKKWIPGHYEYDWYATNNANRGLWNSPMYGGSTGINGSAGDRFSVTASGAVSQVNVNGALRGVDYSKGESVKATAAAAINQVAPQSAELHDGMATMDWNDAGITVPGSKSEQKFSTVTMGAMDPQKHSMVLKLLGETPDNIAVTKPVTVKHKPKCVTCGKQNKHNAKFCTECGTALEVFA